ncbi:MAG TPA: DUF6600 domain-containing protein [Burkholderiaceae bacterium]|nr:DUF6600 domain-containing protein [Burkholderiaceae bacterium]
MTSHTNPSRHPVACWRVAAAALLAGLALASGAAWADPPGRVGRVAAAEGTVWLYDDAQGEWIEARRNRPVTAGDRVSTERGARAAIQVGSSTVRLDGSTDVEFADLDDERVRLRLHAGSLTLRVRSAEAAREFAVLTDEGRYEPQRPGRYRIDRRDDGSFGAAIGGRLRFEAPDSALEIADGQRAEFWRERGATHYAWSALPDDRFADWAAREDREDDREFARERERRYVSPEMTGSDDLDRHGRWDRHPEYGVIWYPTVVAAGWAPYRYGHWAYVRPWGWTWVDDAPWGFAPFHYGRWVSWGGRWGWCPGQYVARPVYAPALVAWIGGDNFSIGINLGGPAVGWVPLAPREVYRPPYSVTNVYIRNINVTHERWQPPPQRAVPTGPIMYSNQGVPGGVTVVSSQVLRERQPISAAVIKPVDPRTIATWQQQQQQRQVRPAEVVPPAPPARVQATPGAAVPAPPGATRATPWTAPGQARSSRDDAGEAQRVRPPGQRVEAAPERRVETRPERGEPPRAPQAAPREMPRDVQRDGGSREAPREVQREVPRDVQREAPAPVPPAPRVQRPGPREAPSEVPRVQPPAPVQAIPVPPTVQPQRPAGPPASPAARPGAPEGPRDASPPRGARERDDERAPKDKRRGAQDEREQQNR